MNAPETQVVVSGGFHDVRSRELRFLQEAARLGPVTLLLWPDEMLTDVRFPLQERLYYLAAVRYVSKVIPMNRAWDANTLPSSDGFRPDVWVDAESAANEARRAFCRQQGLRYQVLRSDEIKGFPQLPVHSEAKGRKKVVVTGCYDWFHSGHVRFFEEVNSYGDLYVIVGHDANIRQLKGPGHPLLPQEERRYVAGSIRYVAQALVSSGTGWLDADPEIQRLKPDIYAVNEDGDKGGKREYCAQHGIEYVVLKRIPAAGLAPRSSTDLRGF